MLVSQILKNKASGVITVKPDASLREVVELLSTRRIGAVVVSSDGKKVKGIVSERDIVLGGRELLRKPFSPAALVGAVRAALSR